METVLFLCHRLPFPPNKGDKITTYNLLHYLRKRYKLVVGCFVDDPHDRQYISDVEALCDELHVVDICERSFLKSGLKALLMREPVSKYHYKSADMENWVKDVVEKRKISRLFSYSAGTAQFIESSHYETCVRVLDMADVDSDKWTQYANNKPFYSSWIYRRESKLVANYEQKILNEFDAVTLITDDERDLFRRMSAAVNRKKIVTLGNGVDTEYFSPDAEFDFTERPDEGHQLICFTGAMDYWANVDAVVWFVENVWPELRRQHSELYFYIVGGKPTQKVKELARVDGVVVTGRVVDVRPFVAQSLLCVAPLRIARGVQNKVLEAMSMGKAVVMTSMGQEGIKIPDIQNSLVADEAVSQSEIIGELINQYQKAEQIGGVNREWIIQNYGWESALSLLEQLLEKDK